MSDYAFSRGYVKPGENVYLVGKVKTGKTDSDLPSFLGDVTDPEKKYFFLCQNRYPSQDYERLYWSCDPDDILRNYKETSLNEGAVQLRLDVVEGTVGFNMMYSNHFNDGAENLNVGLPHPVGDDLNKIKRNFNEFSNDPSYFGINQKNYNLDPNTLFYSVPYDFRSNNNLLNSLTTSSYTEWPFRVCTDSVNTDPNSSDPIGVSSRADINFFQQSSDLFQQCNVSYTTVSGIGVSVNGTSIRITNTDYEANKDRFDLFPTNSGIIKLEDTSDSTNFTYMIYNNITPPGPDGIHIEGEYTTQLGRGGTSPSADIVSGQITIELRNRVNTNYNVFQKISSTDKSVSEWMDIFLLPVTKDANFANGTTLKNLYKKSFQIVTPLYNSDSSSSKLLDIFNPGNGQSLKDSTTNQLLKENFYRDFVYFYIFSKLSALNPTYWTTASSGDHPRIAKDGDGNTQITIFTWGLPSEAKTGYMYSYCSGEPGTLSVSYCGNCYGYTKNNLNRCIVTPETRNRVLNGENNPLFSVLTGAADDTTRCTIS